jgi:hypothetical protein
MKNLEKKASTTLLIVAMFFSFSVYAGDKDKGKKSKENHVILAYDLDKAHVEIDYLSINDLNTEENLTLDNVKPAVFDLSHNMDVNGTHISGGEYVVSLIKLDDGLGFNFHNISRKTEDIQVALFASPGEYSNYLNYSLEVTEQDKISGEFNWKENTYSFDMEISISNYVFTEIEDARSNNTAEWIDFYQAGIYAYLHNIDLENSYIYAKKAYKKEQNEYTTELKAMYLTALGRESEADELLNTVAVQ